MDASTNILFLCRLCGSKTVENNRINIFDSSGISIDINTKINFCLEIEVNENDYLPKVVCIECINNLENFNIFKIKSKETANILHTLFNQKVQPVIISEEENVGGVIFGNAVDNSNLLLVPEELHIKTNDFELQSSNLNNENTEEIVDDTDDNSNKIIVPDFQVETLNEFKSRPNSLKMLEQMLSNDSLTSNNSNKNESILYEILTKDEPKISNEYDMTSIQCIYCPDYFSCIEELSIHLQVTHDYGYLKGKELKAVEQIFKCAFCPNVYNYKLNLIKHMRTHNNLECTYCEMKFSNRSKFKLHIQQHEKRYNFVCEFCGKGFYQKITLLSHERKKHTKDYQFQCNKCEKKYAFEYELTKHDLIVHKNNSTYVCDVCNKTCKNPLSLKEHKKYKHEVPLKERKRFNCTLCEASFLTKKNAKHHMLKHTGELPHKCDQCGKRFRILHGLKKHILVVHDGEKNFICSDCGKKFASLSNLKTHQNVHTRERKFECQFCNKIFTQSSSRNAHIKKSCCKKQKASPTK